jgi:hypothetical protein
MKRRSFIKNTAVLTAASAVSIPVTATKLPKAEKEFYEIREYQLTGSNAKNHLKKYISEAVIPLMNNMGVKVGAFGEYSLEDPPKVFILYAYPNYNTWIEIQKEFSTNTLYLKNAKWYLKSDPAKPLFTRYETYLTEAFDALPNFNQPDKNRGLFELRTYESYNEDAGLRKINMFNNEELPLFKKVGLHPVFFSKILAGKYMPALIYMLWFKNMDERNSNWEKFTGSKEWNTMKIKPEYKNTVSKVNKKFLIPLDYSQI